MPRPPRIPTWVIALVTIVFLGGSVALFVAGNREPAPTPKATVPDDGSDGSELQLPSKDDAVSDERRRGTVGRTRIATADGRDISTDEAEPTDDAGEAQELEALRGRAVALVPADASVPDVQDPSATTRIGNVAVPCAVGRTSTAARTFERGVLDDLERRLRAAGVRVTRIDDASGVAPCAPQRSTQAEAGEITLVVATTETPGAELGVAAARPAGKLTAADTQSATRLVAGIAAATGVPRLDGTAAALSKLLAQFGAIERPGGGTTAWVVLPDEADRSDAARLLARGLVSYVTEPADGSTTAAEPATAKPSTAKPSTAKPSTAKPSATTPTPATPGTAPTTTTPADENRGTTAGDDD